MNIYLLTQTETTGYDTYDSAVVVAANSEQAASIHPSKRIFGGGVRLWNSHPGDELENYWAAGDANYGWLDWASSPATVLVTLLGTADPQRIDPEVVCASFRAG